MKPFINRIIRLNLLILSRKTGRPSVCADNVGVSERTLFSYLRILKDLGVPIKYSRKEQTFYYSEKGELIISFVLGGSEQNSSERFHLQEINLDNE
jgi:hypothetical protein